MTAWETEFTKKMADFENPVPFCREFIRNKEFANKVLGEERYQFARRYIFDLLGKEKILKLIREVEVNDILKRVPGIQK